MLESCSTATRPMDSPYQGPERRSQTASIRDLVSRVSVLLLQTRGMCLKT